MRAIFGFLGLAVPATFFLTGCVEQNITGTPNTSPKIVSLVAEPDTLYSGESTEITLDARDDEGDELIIQWTAKTGYITGSGSKVYFSSAGCHVGVHLVSVAVMDYRGGRTTRSIGIEVL